MKKLILILGCVLALAACDNKKEETQEKPVIKIGALYPMSGDGAVFGEAAKNAVKIFFEEFNRKPHKFDYQVVFEDNQYTLAKQATLTQKLINTDKVDVLISVMSNFGAITAPTAEQNKIIHFCVATDPEVSKGFYNLITSSNPAGETEMMYQKLLKEGAKKVDIVTVNATGPEALLDYLEKRINQDNQIKISQIFHVNADEKDFRILLYKIKENNPDYVLVQLEMPTIDIFMKQYKSLGINIPVTGIESFTFMKNKELVENMWYVDAASATNEYIKKYENTTSQSTTNYAEYMDFILQMITFGYEGASTTDKAAVIEYIQNNASGQKTAVGVISTEPDGILNGQPVLKKIINAEAGGIEE